MEVTLGVDGTLEVVVDTLAEKTEVERTVEEETEVEGSS